MSNQFVTTMERENRRAVDPWTTIALCVSILVVCGLALFTQPCFAQSTVAQGPWQKMQMPTTAEVAIAWKNPPPEYGPEPYFGLNGPVTIESLAIDLDTAKSLGFHAVTAQAGGGMTTAYLTPEYFAFFKQFAEEAKKRDMKIWIVDDIGYPGGFDGGMMAKQKPDLTMQGLSLTPGIAVKAGATLNQSVSPNAVSGVAVRATGEHMSLAVTGGMIAWTAPAGGDWTVYVVEHIYRSGHPSSPFTGALEDYMDPMATAAYIGFNHQGYYNAMPELFGNTIIGFRGDEPAYTIPGLPWTPKFFDTFQQEKGYDVRPYLGVLVMSEPQQRGFGGQPATPPPAAPPFTDAEKRAKADYYDIYSQMFRDGFFKPLGLWAAAHGVEYQVHLDNEEREMTLVRCTGDFERAMQYMQVPGIDVIQHQVGTDTVSDYPRLASSAAHIYGHPRSFTESFAAMQPAPDVTQARYILNEQMVRGINLIETMMYSATRPAGAPPEPARSRPPTATAATVGGATPLAAPPRPRNGPSELMRDPAWPALMDYVHRLGYVMSMGRPAAQVALYIPTSSMWLDDSAADSAFVATERLLSERQIDFDIINISALAEDLKPGPGTLETMSGNQYRTVVIPYADVLSQVELDRLKALVKGGGKVLFLGRTPSLISGKSIMDSHAATPADFAWAVVETSAQLPPSPSARTVDASNAKQVVPAAIEMALNRVIGTREVALDAPDAALKVNTRRLKDADVYLFFNEGAQASSHTVTLKTAGKRVEAWDPATGTVAPVTSTAGKGAVMVKLDLKPYETELLTVR
ncbi:MAG TPA: glycosyl hydrolase [Acidobacteriaceae bacterium]|nr:glycosyl hydrolase [Acidobacteriaceae bacterium]